MSAAVSISPSIQYADHKTPLIANSWYLACLSAELDAGLVGRTLLGRKVVLYRTEEGAPAALQDRCAHRAFPLSKGFRQGSNLVCGYHGMKYGPDGRCAALPAEGRPAPQIRIDSFVVAERAPVVWIWMGDPALADEAAIPQTPWLADANWATVQGYFSIPSNYVGMQENLMDLTHFSYLHSDTVGTPGYATAPATIVPDGLKLKVLRELRGAPPPPIYDVPMGLGGRDVDRFTDANFVSPGAHLAYASIAVRDPAVGERDLYRVNFLHAITPQTQDSLHYWWFLTRDFAQDDALASEYLTRMTTKAFNEDVEALTLIAEQHRDGEDWREMSFGTDKPGLAMRKNLMLMARAEAGS